jgi:hypothetical protein
MGQHRRRRGWMHQRPTQPARPFHRTNAHRCDSFNATHHAAAHGKNTGLVLRWYTARLPS